jgi:hypothetical protein
MKFEKWVEAIRRRREKVELAMDLWKTQWDNRRLLEILPAASSGKTALIANSANLPYIVKREVVLANALRMAGWNVIVFLQPKSLEMAETYYRALGFTKFIRWQDISMGPETQTIVEEEMRGFEQVPRSVRIMKNWTCRGCLLGPQILASISRKFYAGRLDLGDEKNYSEIKKMARQGIEYILKAEKIFQETPFDLFVTNEPNYAIYAPLTDIAIKRGTQVIQFFQPNREDSLLCWKLRPETRRRHPASVSSESWERLRPLEWTPELERRWEEAMKRRYDGTWFLQRRNQWNVSVRDVDQVRSGLRLDPTKKTAIVFTGVLWDANLFYGEDLFEDNGEWFVETVRAACRNPAVNWVIKLHPANRWKLEFEKVQGELGEIKMIRQHIGELPDHVKLLMPDAPYATPALFQLADAAVTVRGSIGVELPCYGIPVLTGGTGRYSGLGFTLDSQTKEEYLERLARVQDCPRLSPELIVAAKKHALAVFEARWWVMKTYRAQLRPARYPRDPLDRNYVLNKEILVKNQMPPDYQSWLDWAQDTASTPDYFQWNMFEKSEPVLAGKILS